MRPVGKTPGIVTPRARSQQPLKPYGVNRRSWQSDGLVFWITPAMSFNSSVSGGANADSVRETLTDTMLKNGPAPGTVVQSDQGPGFGANTATPGGLWFTAGNVSDWALYYQTGSGLPAWLTPTNVTLVCWCLFTSTPAGSSMLGGVSANDTNTSPFAAFVIQFDGSSHWGTTYSTGGAVQFCLSATVPSTNTVYAVVARFSGTKQDLWANGTGLANTATGFSYTTTNTSCAGIGWLAPNGLPSLNSHAVIWDFRIYNRFFTDTEVLAISQPSALWDLYAPVRESLSIGLAPLVPQFPIWLPQGSGLTKAPDSVLSSGMSNG